MASYTDNVESPYSPYSDNARDETSSETEQHERLLDSEQNEKAEELEYRTESRLRTGWVVLGSIATVLLMFAAMVFFVRLFVAEDHSDHDPTILSNDFRRPSSDYILHSKWDFSAPNQVRSYNWTILDRVANPDGVFRPMITINGKFPGPMIECNEGDTLIINVDNQGSNATSMHFHGIFQNGTNWMDGTTGITQCPIAPGGSFQYKFKVDGQSGTYYYHGHQGVQISDGLFGPLVVHARNEKQLQQIPYISDRVVMVQDYYHDLSSGLLRESLSPGNEGSPAPDGALINGRNVKDCSQIGDRLCDSSANEPPIFDLAPNSHHRLRFLNVGAFAWFEIGLDEHNLDITEVDGTDVYPVSVNQLHISPAQRYSAIVGTNITTGTSFWLRARIMKHCFKEAGRSDDAYTVNAVVRYSKPSPKSTLTPETKVLLTQPTSRNTGDSYGVICRDMDNTKFVPVEKIAAPAHADDIYPVRTNLQIGDWRLERGFFNDSSYRPNVRSPTLHRIIEGLQTSNESFSTSSASNGVNALAFDTSTELVVQTSGIRTIDLIIQNFDEGNHPMHLHGNKFWVLAQGHAYFPDYDHLSLDLSNPIRRDTASVEGFGWMLIRFVSDNPGIWAFHCHMAWHSEAGLVMQFLNRPEIMRDWILPEENLKLCDGVGLERGMPPKDEIWFGDGIGG